uniref:DNA mismatch repair protein MutS2 n=3 Tax=Tetraselmis sp. GSL018 TaxID=582737 RepID=A0A061RIK4_9CHLO
MVLFSPQNVVVSLSGKLSRNDVKCTSTRKSAVPSVSRSGRAVQILLKQGSRDEQNSSGNKHNSSTKKNNGQRSLVSKHPRRRESHGKGQPVSRSDNSGNRRALKKTRDVRGEPRIGDSEDFSAKKNTSSTVAASTGVSLPKSGAPLDPDNAAVEEFDNDKYNSEVPESNQTDGESSEDFISESYELLEWRKVCEQVACFTCTSMAAEAAVSGALPVGETLEESEHLLQETEEAGSALRHLRLASVLDVRPGLPVVAAGGALSGLQLHAVAEAVAAALRVSALLGLLEWDALAAAGAAAGSLSHCSALREAMAGAVDEPLVGLLLELRRCVAKGGDLKDSASDVLEYIREERRQNHESLREVIRSAAQFAFQKGLSSAKEGSFQMGRQCVSVKRGRQGELPNGGVTLATSNTGATLYVEPTDAIPLNNEAAKLAAAESEEEAVIRLALSRMAGACGESLLRLIDAVVGVDIACARAKHAAWMDAARPTLRPYGGGGGEHQIRLRGIRHPLLLQPSLPDPPLPPLVGDAVAAFSSRFLGRSDAAPVPLTEQKRRKQQHREADAIGANRPPPPKSIDILVPRGTSVVAVTGPNTGGKTASLKTLGLACAMAKSGMFLPAEAAAEPPEVVWFDRILADVGDGQSLQQSLSTFSGHIRRVQAALEAATPQSLVLLDELGSGTDPAEGAALATALLEELHRRAALTYVTSHYWEVKELADQRDGFINAAVEFDLATLSPTYRLTWGEAGASNALNVASRLGFDPEVVAAAREVLLELGREGHGGEARAGEMADALRQQEEAARAEVEEAKEHRRELESQAQRLEAEREALRARWAAAEEGLAGIGRFAGDVSARAKAAVDAHASGGLALAEAEARLREIEALIPDTSRATATLMGIAASGRQEAPPEAEDGAAWQSLLEDQSGAADAAAAGDWAPQAGDAVRVLKMGGAEGVVLRSRRGGGLTVKVGALSMDVRASDVAPSARAEPRRRRQQQREEARGPEGGRRGSRPRREDSSGGGGAVAIQTSRNTVDVRGQTAEEAISEVNAALADLGRWSTLFVVHGVGTGRLRQQIHAKFRRHPLVTRIEMEENSAGGCSILYLE